VLLLTPELAEAQENAAEHSLAWAATINRQKILELHRIGF